MKERCTSQPHFLRRRRSGALLVCAAAACSLVSGTLVPCFHAEIPATVSPRNLTFAERLAYQRAVEKIYWRHRVWPKERHDPKPSLDGVMSQAQLEKKVEDYLRKSRALEDYWQRLITAEQLQAEMDRMAKNTRQPEVLRDLFQALGNDPFVIAECLARPALANRLLTNWYPYDQRIHGELKQSAEADLRTHRAVGDMKQLSGKYAEIQLLKSDNSHEAPNPAAEHGINLNSREWDETVHKLTAMFNDSDVAAGVSPAKDRSVMQIKTGVISSLQEDEQHFYAMAVIDKTDDHIKLAAVSWLKEPREFWLARAQDKPRNVVAVMRRDYTLPTISEGAGCIDDTWAATGGLPDARAYHTSVWTGDEMIVWGGASFGNYLATGGRYNPSTDSWTATSSTNAPNARAYHTAVWTGGEMIVWGGYDGVNYLNTGGRYDPTTDSWTVISTANAPTRRYHHTAVWTGGEMIAWGGYLYDGTNHWLNTGGRYNPSTNSWTATGTNSAPAGREQHTGVWAGGEMIVWAGYNGSYLNTGGRYNPSTDSWTATNTTNGPSARYVHTAVWTGSEMIVWGGYNGSSYINTGGKYNPSTDSWTATSTTNAPSARTASAVWTANEMVVWGGYDGNWLNTGARYNPVTNSWVATSITDAPSARYGHTAVWTGSEMIVWGGGTGRLFNTGGRYNPGTDSWAPTGVNNAPSARAVHTAVWTGSEMIVWGGYYYPPSTGWNTGGRYDPATDDWTATSTTNAPEARYYHTAVWTGSEMIVWGGYNGSTFFNTGGRYNPSTDNWTAISTANAPAGRFLHTAVWTASQMIVWGGSPDSGFSFLNTGGRYNPSTDSWTATSIINAPDARESHTAVWTGSEMIVWGGVNGPNGLNSGGRYDPIADSWTATSATNAPSARYYHTAVWTGSEMIVWGGYDDFSFFNTGRRYNPSTDSWTATSLTNAPSARFYHTAIWTGAEMIVWGGSNAVGDRFNTGGRYNPGTSGWTASSANAPPGRSNHTAVWTGSEMVVWGGYDGNNYLNTGGRYCAAAPIPTPTPTATASITPTPTATASATPTGTPGATATPRTTPTPRSRPTPVPRPSL